MTDQDINEAQATIEQISQDMNELFSGHLIGHIIPAMIFMLAATHDKTVMSKEKFVAEVAKELAAHIDLFEQENKGEMQWLQ